LPVVALLSVQLYSTIKHKKYKNFVVIYQFLRGIFIEEI